MDEEPNARAIHTPGGWKIEMDHAAWVRLMGALTIAIDSELRAGKQPNVDLLRKLRTALGHAEQVEG